MPFRTALVNMPFGFHIYPSIQLGTLSTLLKSHGYEAKSYYLNLHFAHQLGLPVYNELCETRQLIGEWLFSHSLFGDSPGNRKYADTFERNIQSVCKTIDRSPEYLLEVKEKMVPEFLRWAVDSVDWGQYEAVGFTSTFNQNLASVTLAKLIKEKYPSVKILFGGSNFDSEMGLEYFRTFDWIDYVVQGEAEPILPALMGALENGGEIPPGVIHRKGREVVLQEGSSMFEGFEKYGPPDYEDYFEQLRGIDPESPHLENPVILYETARGCWWGEKHHCTFCGLNASTMKFRARSIEQVHADISALSKRYDTFRFRLVDNILEMSYIDGVFKEFAQENYDLQFFIEVKSNLNKGQIKNLALGGVNVIQPGIESFSANQLNDMDKGVRPMQNIFFLKWAMYYGIDVTWNILTGFPGEIDDDYRRQTDMLKNLIHLQPPIGVGDLWLERFSPYFTRPGDYGVKITGPSEAYPYVYDAEKLDLMKIAYDFEFETENRISPDLAQELRQTVDDWKGRHQSEQMPFLFFTKSLDFVTVYDGRSLEGPSKVRFEGPSAWILSFCNEKPRALEQIRSHVAEKSGPARLEDNAVDLAIQDLEGKNILYGERGKYLTLPLPHNSHL